MTMIILGWRKNYTCPINPSYIMSLLFFVYLNPFKASLFSCSLWELSPILMVVLAVTLYKLLGGFSRLSATFRTAWSLLKDYWSLPTADIKWQPVFPLRYYMCSKFSALKLNSTLNPLSRQLLKCTFAETTQTPCRTAMVLLLVFLLKRTFTYLSPMDS